MAPGREVRIDGATLDRIERLASERGATTEELVTEALDRFVEENR